MRESRTKRELSGQVQQAIEASKGSQQAYLSDIAAYIASKRKPFCSIRLVSSGAKDLRDRVRTWTRITTVEVEWPNPAKFDQPEHWIFYDRRLSAPAAVRRIAHELYHIWEHCPEDPSREADPDNSKVKYTDEEERDADVFSLAILKNHPFDRRRKFPLSNEQLFELLDKEAGWPHYLKESQIRRIADQL